MWKRDRVGMKAEPMEWAASPSEVADNWVTDKLAMDPQLIGPTGDRLEFDQRGVRVFFE
jgi:hypothetical protein